MGRAARVLRLPLAEQVRIARMAALRVALEPMLRSLPLPRVARLMGVRLGASADPPAPKLAARALPSADARAVRAAGLLTSGGRDAKRRCLRHALLAGHALRRHDPVLRIGAARRDGTTTAHAWIEVLGGRIDAGDAAEYRPLRGPARK